MAEADIFSSVNRKQTEPDNCPPLLVEVSLLAAPGPVLAFVLAAREPWKTEPGTAHKHKGHQRGDTGRVGSILAMEPPSHLWDRKQANNLPGQLILRPKMHCQNLSETDPTNRPN